MVPGSPRKLTFSRGERRDVAVGVCIDPTITEADAEAKFSCRFHNASASASALLYTPAMPASAQEPEGASPDDVSLPPDRAFGENVKRLLSKRGANTAAAHAIGLTGDDPTRMIRHWKSGKYGISVSRLHALARYTGEDPDSIYPKWRERVGEARRPGGRHEGKPGPSKVVERRLDALEADVASLVASHNAAQAELAELRKELADRDLIATPSSAVAQLKSVAEGAGQRQREARERNPEDRSAEQG